MLMMILQQFNMTVQNPGQGGKAKDVQFVLCGLVQVIMVRVGASVDTPTGEQIVNMIIESFR